MEWQKLKNLIILILLMVNGFLLVLVAARREESLSYERSALDYAVQVLENSGIHVETGAIGDADHLPPLSVERDLEQEARLARALLGNTAQAENRGGGLYLYQNGDGELGIRAGGELSAELADSPSWLVKDPERHAAGLLKQMGIDAEQTGVTKEGEWTRVRFRQLWNGAPVFSCEVEFSYYQDSLLRSIQGTLLPAGQTQAEEGQVMALPTALLRFMDGVTDTGDVCSAIRSMQAGYRAAAQPLSGSVRLTAAWLVSSNTADYYLDAATGALTRLSAEPS